jgi:hypothetical protein
LKHGKSGEIPYADIVNAFRFPYLLPYEATLGTHSVSTLFCLQTTNLMRVRKDVRTNKLMVLLSLEGWYLKLN